MSLKMGEYGVGCHSCASADTFEYVDDFDHQKYRRVIKCSNCGAEVRQMPDEKSVEVYDPDGNLVTSGLAAMPAESD